MTFARTTAAAAAMTALSALLCWAAGLAPLTCPIPSSPAMNPMTAACLLLGAAAVFLKTAGHARAAAACAGTLVAVGAARLIGYVSAQDIGIDRLLFAARLDESSRDLPNRMAPNSALNFLFCGAALLLQDKGRALRRAAETGLLAVLLISFVSFVGHIVGAPGLYQPLPHIGMAANTAFAFIALGISLLSLRPDQGLAAVVADRGPGGIMARRTLPASLAALLVIGILRLWGERTGFYDAVFGVGLVIVSCSIIIATIILWTAASLNRAAKEAAATQKRAY